MVLLMETGIVIQYPLAFKYLECRDACLKGLDRAFRDRYLRDDVLDENID